MRLPQVVLTVLLTCLGSHAIAAGAPAAAPALRTKALQAELDRWAAEPGHHGVSASVIWRDGKQWNGVAGHEDSNAVIRSEHLFPLASITKTMTGAVILQLVDESRLALTDTVSRWLGRRANLDPRITVRQLLDHTSGVESYNGGPLHRMKADPSYVFTADELLASVPAPRSAPGDSTHYTNTAFVALARVAELVTGRPMHELYRERLWRPLGLSESFFAGHEPAPGPMARAYAPWGHVQPLDDVSRLSLGHGAGAVCATARDVARWGHALFAGTVISPRMQRAMRTLVPAAGNIPGESGAGLGIRGYDFMGRKQFGHSGGSWLGNSLLIHDPSLELTVVVLTNQGSGADHFKLAPRLLEVASQH